MILDLERYQDSSPYPVIGSVKPDKQLAKLLMEGYSGESSELTTVMQYAYHSMKCKKNYGEISEVLRGVFYVETLHMNFLGECINKLGIDPHYTISLREKNVSWSTSVVEYENTPSKMLLADIQGEKGAVAFYEEMAASVDQPNIAKLLARLAEDEKLHVRIFSDLHRRYFR